MSKRVLIRAGLFLLFSIAASQGCSSREAENVDEQSSRLDPSDAEAGSCADSVPLESTRVYRPLPRIVPGIATFSPAVAVVVPSEIPVVVGASSDRRAVLTFQHGDDRVWCFYRGEPPGTRYAFRYCSAVDEPEDNGDVCDANSRPHAGDAVAVDRVVLRVLNGDSTNAAGKTTGRVTLEVRCGDGGASDASDASADVADSTVADGSADAPVESSSDATNDAPVEANLCEGVVCEAQGPCRAVGTCDPNTGQCSNPPAPDNSLCDDGNACTQLDTCQAGACVGSNPVVCSATSQCSLAGVCDPTTGLCTNPPAPNDSPCSDGDRCTQTDTCQNGVCVGSNPVVCGQLDQCHGVGVCEPSTGTCTNPIAPDNTPCSDADLCTIGDSCQSGVCTGGAPVVCPASDACHLPGICNAATGACVEVAAPDDSSCDDANPCTQSDSCQAGVCVGANPVVCAALDQCHESGVCNSSTGTCSNPAKADGSSCSDGNSCTQGDVCVAGACTAGTPVTCTASDRCHAVGTCDPSTGACSNPAIPGCDPVAPGSDTRFETRASLIGKVVDRSGAAVTGYTLAVLDAAPATGAGAATPRSDVVVQNAGDGSFRARLTSFAESEAEHTPPRHVLVRVSSPTTIPAVREAFLHPGMVTDVGTIKLVPLDSNVTVIGAAGGTARDSQNLVEVVFPPGAVSTNTPVSITPFLTRDELPYPLPTTTMTTYAMHFEPEGLVFPVSAKPTVRLANWRNYPTTLKIPVGYANTATGEWEHEAIASWDGARFAFSIGHFSDYDANVARDLLRVVFRTLGFDKAPKTKPDAKGNPRMCVSSSVEVGSGSLSQLAGSAEGGTQRRGQNQGVTLQYESQQTAGGESSSTSGNYGVVPAPRLLPARGKLVTSACMSRGAADQILSSDPNACGTAGCGAGATRLDIGRLTHGWEVVENGSIDGFEVEGDVELPSTTGGAGGELPAPTWVRTSFQARTSGSGGCGRGAASAFGGNGATIGGSGGSAPSATLTSPAGDPVAEFSDNTFVAHKHNSSSGAGWGVTGIDRAYPSPDGGEMAIIAGAGTVELFSPRARSRMFSAFAVPMRAYARDPLTNEILEARADGTIQLVSPSNGAETPLFTGLSLGNPQALAVVYVGSARHVIVAADTQLTDINAGGFARALATRAVPGGNFFFIGQVPGVAGANGWLYYTSGLEADVGLTPDRALYRFDLTQANPIAEPISFVTGGDISLDPKGSLSTMQFGAPHGLAMSASGSLYVADRARDIVYEVLPNLSGVIGPDSKLVRVVGTGSAQSATAPGLRMPGRRFAVNQPALLSTAPDGTLWMASPFGFAVYDPISTEATWLVLDGGIAGSDQVHKTLSATNQRATFVALSNVSFLFRTGEAGLGNFVARTDVDLLASNTDPTRTITRNLGGGWLLTDTTQDVVEAYDANGRLVERRTREGDPILAVNYVDADSDRIDKIFDPTGSYTQFSYANGKLQSYTDAAGRTTQVTVNAQGDLVELVHPDGERWAYEYQAHRMTKKTSPRGDVTTYTYRADGTLETSTKPNAEVFTLSASVSQTVRRDAQGRIIRDGFYIDQRGVRHDFVLHDRLGWILKDTFVADGTTYVIEHQLGRLGSSADTPDSLRNNLGRVTSTTVNGLIVGPVTSFDTLGRKTKVQVDQSSVLESCTFGADDRLASFFRGPASNDFGIERDLQGRVARVFERSGGAATGRETRFTYLPSGLVETMTDHDVTTTLSYDAQQNVTATSDTLGRTSTFTYDAAGNVATANDGSTTWSFVHDANNRLRTATDALGNTTTLSYTDTSCGCSEKDLLTGIHTPDLPATKEWKLDYAPDGRLSTIIDPDGRAETYTYEPSGELKTVTDRMSRTTSIGHDQLGRVTSILDTLGRTHQRAYPTPIATGWTNPNLLIGSANATNATSSLTGTLRDGDYQIGENGYDRFNGAAPFLSMGYPQQTVYRDATIDVRYNLQFDYAGRLTQRRDVATNGGQFFENIAYHGGAADPVVSLVSTNAPSGIERADLFYNANYDLGFANGSNSSRNVGAQYSYSRDTAGRVTRIDRTWVRNVTQGFATGPSTTYTYYPNGKLHTRTGADGDFTYAYDTRGLLETITVVINGNTETWSFEYDAVGRNNLLVFPDGHRRVQVFDAQGRITSRCYSYATPALDRCYTAQYDAVGNPTRMTDPEGEYAIEYDSLDRITRVTRGPPDNTVEDYGYNALGALKLNAGVALDMKRPRLDGAGLADSAVPGTFNGQPVVLDQAGRITSLDGTTLEYTARSQLVKATKGASVETYGFDSFYRRISLEGPARSELYVYEGDNVVATTNFGASVQDRYLYDGIDHPLRLERAGQRVFFEIDLAGSVRRLRGVGGNDLGGYRYTAFGKTVAPTGTTPTPSVDQPLRWQGRWVDPVTGLYDVRARQWSPSIGAFVQIDEYAFHTMSTTLWGWPRQNPAARRDPTGHKDLFACMKSTPFGDFGKLLACWTSGPDSLDIGSGTIFRGMDPNAGARQKAEEAWNKAYDDCIARGGSWKKCQEEADKAEDAKLIELGLPPKNQTQCGGLPIAPAPFPIPVVP